MFADRSKFASRAGPKPALSFFLALTFLLSLLLAPASAWAHRPGESYLRIVVEEGKVMGELDLSLRDLEETVGLDVDGNGSVTYEELVSREPAIAQYTLPRLKIRGDGHEAILRATNHVVASHSDGIYAVVEFAVDGIEAPLVLEVGSSLFFDINPQHQTLLQVVSGKEEHVAALTIGNPRQRFELGASDAGRMFLHFLGEGAKHIAGGLDHALFLLALLLPAVLVRVESAWRPVENFRPAFWNAVKVVTAFTVAHAVTLTLATTGLVHLPARPVEVLIAASVIFAALNNLRPLVRERTWLVAFGFGFIHGFGYASVLGDLGLKGGSLAQALVSFNVGVELGQLTIVAGLLPVAYSLRQSKLYQQGIFKYGSLAIAGLAFLWLLQRAFDWKLLPIG